MAIIQARLGSSRLPGKVLLDLAGEPMLKRVVDRVKRARGVDEIVIATTLELRDDLLERMCAERNWPCFRGSEQDVLDRYYQAALSRKADVVVRITSDCPLIDPAVVDQTIEAFLARQPGLDYAATLGYPRGLDTEVFSFEALSRAWREAADPRLREHVTAHIYQHPQAYALHWHRQDPSFEDQRWTVDTAEDLKLIELIFNHFRDEPFSWRDVMALLQRHPDWQEINRHIVQKAV